MQSTNMTKIANWPSKLSIHFLFYGSSHQQLEIYINSSSMLQYRTRTHCLYVLELILKRVIKIHLAVDINFTLFSHRKKMLNFSASSCSQAHTKTFIYFSHYYYYWWWWYFCMHSHFNIIDAIDLIEYKCKVSAFAECIIR